MAEAAADLDADLELLRSCAVAGGILAAGYFRRNVRTWTKDNATPVTEADMAVDQYLRETLLAARPDYGWLSEETTDSDARLGKKHVFVVDPIDGTRAFIRGEDNWTLSLAVVEDGVAVAGVVYAPVRDELYQARRGGGAFLNARPLPPLRPRHLPLIPAPAAVHSELEAAGLVYERGAGVPSLAYRLVLVAAGKLDAMVARRGAHDWDIAGAAVILNEAGVKFTDVCAGPPLFNKRIIRHAALAAFADPSLKTVLHNVLRTVYGCPDDQDGMPMRGETQS